jgi:hypothetical protein
MERTEVEIAERKGERDRDRKGEREREGERRRQ